MNRLAFAHVCGTYDAKTAVVFPPASRLLFGGIVCLARLVDCVPITDVIDQPFACGPWCWILDEIEKVDFLPCRGFQGLWNAGRIARAVDQ